MIPRCPFDVTHRMVKKTYSHTPRNAFMPVTNDYWVCLDCKKHWSRNGVVIKSTSRPGLRPKSY